MKEQNETQAERIEKEISDIGIVESSHVNQSKLDDNPPSVYVGFNTEYIPTWFSNLMLDRGYALHTTAETSREECNGVYRLLTDFGGN
jgi:hypothetical protein